LANVEAYKSSFLTADQVVESGAAHVAVATGARWRRDGYGRTHQFPIPGTEGHNVLTPDDIMAGVKPEGTVLIYDDDHYYMGSVMAEQLVADGYQVILVTPESIVASWTHYTMEQHIIQSRLLKLGVEIIANHQLQEINEGNVGLACAYSGQTRMVEASSVVMVVSRLPEDSLYQELVADPDRLRKGGIKTVKRIGDCYGPSIIAAAVYEGHRFARELGEDTPEIWFRRELTELAEAFELP
jgi:dimethylamine/trimethylamine dehydrogenase